MLCSIMPNALHSYFNSYFNTFSRRVVGVHLLLALLKNLEVNMLGRLDLARTEAVRNSRFGGQLPGSV